MFDVINRMLIPIRKKIFLLIGRAILTAVDNSGEYMKIQVTALNNETITDLEKIDEYGFSSNPPVDNTEIIVAFINGNRDQGLALKAHNRENRPTDLSEGEVRVYDKNGYKITLTSAGIEIKTGDASSWGPNVMKTCPITGIPHGGIPAGIIKLKGA